MWQEKWERELGRHLFNIQSNVKAKKNFKGHRRDVLTRLRLGHSALNKTLKLVAKHPSGVSEICQKEESVGHVLMECRGYET